MIFLGPCHEGLREALLANFKRFKEEGSAGNDLNCYFTDFDRVCYVLTGGKSEITVNVKISFFSELCKYGALNFLKALYGDMLLETPVTNYSASLKIDLTQLPTDLVDLATKIASFKRNCYASLFEFFFKAQAAGTTSDKAVIPIRAGETLFVQSLQDRVTVIFSTSFKDPTDLLMSKYFMQEFTEVRRKLDRAPQVLYSHREPPKELQSTAAITGDDVFYFTLVLFPRHINDQNKNKTVDLIHSLRNYLHYHIKCSKAYIQMRMRAKTCDFLKVLERARVEEPKSAVVRVLVDSAVGDSSHTSTSYASSSPAQA